MRNYENALEHLRNNPRAVAEFVQAVEDYDDEIAGGNFRFLSHLVEEAAWVLVAGMRIQGKPWEAVGRALGVSRQAAWEMFAPECRAQHIDDDE
jgi:hypothetical protein